MSSKEEEQFAEVTGAPWAASTLLSRFKNRVEDAVAYFFDHGEEAADMEAAARCDADARATTESKATIIPPTIPGQNSGSARRYTQHGSTYSSAANPIRLDLSFPWGYDDMTLYFNPKVTIQQVKESINAQIGIAEKAIPLPLQRFVCNGQNISPTDTMASLSSLLAAAKNKMCVLFPRRDEDGPVVLKNYDTNEDVLVLGAGEWSVTTGVTRVRQMLGELLEYAPDQLKKIRLIFNGLTMLDATTFGQNGIYAQSVITVLLEDMDHSAGQGRGAARRRKRSA